MPSEEQVGIIGIGLVGGRLLKVFPDAVQYDEPRGIGSREEINACNVAFVCVPTPTTERGYCDTRIVEEVVSWCKTPIIVIRSTVQPGTTRLLAEMYPEKQFVFQPEFIGETDTHPYQTDLDVPWIALGHDRDNWAAGFAVAHMWTRLHPGEIILTSWETAELVKYASNVFLAMKVIFTNEIYDISTALGVDWLNFRDLWLHDPRIGESHTQVSEERGYGGSCFPKDVKAMSTFYSWLLGRESSLFNAIDETNTRLRKKVLA